MRDTRESRLLLILLVSIAFALITVDMRSGENSPLDGAREAAAAVFGPVEEGVAAGVDPVANALSAVRESGDRHDRISALEEENAELRQQLGSEEFRDSRMEQVEELLGLAGAGQYGIVGAQVIAIGAAQGFSWTVTIDVGSEDGIAPDMTVLNGDGLVGRVTTVGPSISTVLLANDPNFTVGTRMEGTGEMGFASGRGGDTLQVQLTNYQASVGVGDRMVTLGSLENRPFVPGVPVGEVVNVNRGAGDLTRTVEVRPYVEFTQLDIVGVVVQPPRDDPRDSVLPPRPEETREETRAAGQEGGRGEEEPAGETDADGPAGSEDSSDTPGPDASPGPDANPSADTSPDADATADVDDASDPEETSDTVAGAAASGDTTHQSAPPSARS
ncbi:rod shape-determining protein MreC [Streptomyces sp. 4N509B]|uniref:rod shape-determining protein MreC n=1 Tax=Streptomyces sp. 4N509B TaxID=3457413 RepID=UPI003FD2B378